MIALAREGRSQEADDIHDASGIDKAIEALEALAEYHDKAAAAAQVEAHAAGERARLLVLGALALAIVVGVGVARSREMSGGVRSVVEAMESNSAVAEESSAATEQMAAQ